MPESQSIHTSILVQSLPSRKRVLALFLTIARPIQPFGTMGVSELDQVAPSALILFGLCPQRLAMQA
jgi:hypothetical protein